MNAQEVVDEMNQRASDIRGDGDTPFFSNEVNGYIGSLPVHYEYKGFFDHAEVSDGLVKVFYDGRFTKFRADQLAQYSLSN